MWSVSSRPSALSLDATKIVRAAILQRRSTFFVTVLNLPVPATARSIRNRGTEPEQQKSKARSLQ